MLSYPQAIVIGLLQGVTELFPLSSLGHSVLLPAWLGWHQIVGQQSAEESPYLAFLVGVALLLVAVGLAWRAERCLPVVVVGLGVLAVAHLRDRVDLAEGTLEAFAAGLLAARVERWRCWAALGRIDRAHRTPHRP